MKAQLNEIKRLQKIAGILKEDNSNTIRAILNDLRSDPEIGEYAKKSNTFELPENLLDKFIEIVSKHTGKDADELKTLFLNDVRIFGSKSQGKLSNGWFLNSYEVVDHILKKLG